MKKMQKQSTDLSVVNSMMRQEEIEHEKANYVTPKSFVYKGDHYFIKETETLLDQKTVL